MQPCSLPVSVLLTLEAALFFSLPTWGFTADRAWPADEPLQFTVAVLSGATLGTMLCHFLPSLLGGKGRSKLPQLFPAIWLAGSLGCLLQLLEFPARRTHLGWLLLPGAVVLAIALPRLRIAVMIVSVFSMATLVWLLAQRWTGLWVHNGHFLSEEGFNRPSELFTGMLMSAVPASAIAYCIGRKAAGLRTHFITALFGCWLPMVAGVSIASLTKMAGARLYFRPSLPIDVFWMIAKPMDPASFHWDLWLSLLTLLVPICVFGIWIRECVVCLQSHRQSWPYLGFGVVAGVAMAVYSSQNAPYFEPWLWFVLAANILLAVRLITFRT